YLDAVVFNRDSLYSTGAFTEEGVANMIMLVSGDIAGPVTAEDVNSDRRSNIVQLAQAIETWKTNTDTETPPANTGGTYVSLYGATCALCSIPDFPYGFPTGEAGFREDQAYFYWSNGTSYRVAVQLLDETTGDPGMYF